MEKSVKSGTNWKLLLSCEHATNHVPASYRKLFQNANEILQSHRGWDLGTLELGIRLSRDLGTPLHAGEVSRLLVELNRSADHPRLYSEYSKLLPDEERSQLVTDYWKPYRTSIARDIESLTSRGANVLHLSLHSFTPVMDGRQRDVDIGLLFDPARKSEVEFSTGWIETLKTSLPDLKIRRNSPYRGTSDGLTTSLRKEMPDKSYAGIELEISQRFPLGPRREWVNLQRRLVDSIRNLTSHSK